MRFDGCLHEGVFVFDVGLDDRIDSTTVNVEQIESVAAAVIHPARVDQETLLFIITLPHVVDLVTDLNIYCGVCYIL